MINDFGCEQKGVTSRLGLGSGSEWPSSNQCKYAKRRNEDSQVFLSPACDGGLRRVMCRWEGVVDQQRRSKKRDGRKEGVRDRKRLCVVARV